VIVSTGAKRTLLPRCARFSGTPGAAVAAWHANGAGTPPLPSSDSTPAPPPSTSSKYAALLLAGPVGCWVHETAARGVTVPQLRAIYALARELCAAEGWTSAVTGDRVTAAGLNLYDLVAHLIKPATERANCSAAELVAARPQPPRFFVSHWWGEPVGDFIACLERLLKDRALPEETTNFWVRAHARTPRRGRIYHKSRLQADRPYAAHAARARAPAVSQVCAYALRQWDLGAELRGGIGASPFERALLLADGAVSVLDRTGTYFQRAWCLLELYKSLVDSRPAFLHDIATATPWLTDRRGSVVCAPARARSASLPAPSWPLPSPSPSSPPMAHGVRPTQHQSRPIIDVHAALSLPHPSKSAEI